MEWSADFIESIVNNIGEHNIVPIIGPNVLYIEKNEERLSVQDYIVRTMLQKHLTIEANEQNYQNCSNGVKGMSHLNKLFIKHNKKLNGYMYKLFNDPSFLSLIQVDSDVLNFLHLGHFSLTFTTLIYCILET